MNIRHFAIIGITVLLFGALLTGAVQALESHPAPLRTLITLENVRDYSPAMTNEHVNYAIDAGVLYAGSHGRWAEIRTPVGIIVNAVALDSQRPELVFIGAANELTIFKSTDSGDSWQRVPLSDTPGSVTDIAIDSVQRLVYAGTDTAGVFRMRDVGASVHVGGQLLLDEPVRQVATDRSGLSLAFVRTDTSLYRADNFGMKWTQVDNLHSAPTAIAIADTEPATIYVGTVDRGLLVSTDGDTWELANEGLGFLPGTRLNVDALAIDPIRPEQLYIATSNLNGSTTVHQSPSAIASSGDGGLTWQPLPDGYNTIAAASVTDLLPVSGTSSAVYALSTQSRTPKALFENPAIASWPPTPIGASEFEDTHMPIAATTSSPIQIPAAWLIAALAVMALGAFVTFDLRERGVHRLADGMSISPLDTQTASAVSVG